MGKLRQRWQPRRWMTMPRAHGTGKNRRWVGPGGKRYKSRKAAVRAQRRARQTSGGLANKRKRDARRKRRKR